MKNKKMFILLSSIMFTAFGAFGSEQLAVESSGTVDVVQQEVFSDEFKILWEEKMRNQDVSKRQAVLKELGDNIKAKSAHYGSLNETLLSEIVDPLIGYYKRLIEGRLAVLYIQDAYRYVSKTLQQEVHMEQLIAKSIKILEGCIENFSQEDELVNSELYKLMVLSQIDLLSSQQQEVIQDHILKHQFHYFHTYDSTDIDTFINGVLYLLDKVGNREKKLEFFDRIVLTPYGERKDRIMPFIISNDQRLNFFFDGIQKRISAESDNQNVLGTEYYEFDLYEFIEELLNDSVLKEKAISYFCATPDPENLVTASFVKGELINDLNNTQVEQIKQVIQARIEKPALQFDDYRDEYRKLLRGYQELYSN